MGDNVKLSAALATHNEEKNIGACLESLKDIVDEIIIVDGNSEDKTVEIAKKYGARITQIPNDQMFHRMKQKSFDLAKGDWVLYMDADERLSPGLAKEIKQVVNSTDEEIARYQGSLKNNRLFIRHQNLLEKRDGHIGTGDNVYVAFFFPRLNYFLGKYLRFGGVYPDGVIRLFKKDRAYLPCKDVHEQMEVDGKVGWLQYDLLHYGDPTFSRYLERNNRYINLIVEELKNVHLKKNLFNFMDYFLVKPFSWFLITQIRHKGVLDGIPGIVFSFFSALRFPRAYWRYISGR